MIKANIRQRAYQVLLVAVGYALWLYAGIRTFYHQDIYQEWLLLAAAALAVGSHDAIKLDRLKMRFRLGEAFVLAISLLYGAWPATVTAAVSAFVMALRQGQRQYNLLLLPAASTVAIFGASATTVRLGLGSGLYHTVVLLSLTALLYQVISTVLLAAASAWEERHSIASECRARWAYSALCCLFSTLGALAVYSSITKVGFFAFVITGPILLVAYFTYQNYLDKVEAANQRVSRLAELYLSTIESLTMAIDAKDQITHGHVRRVQLYALELAWAAGYTSDSQVEGLKAAALLHDIGKLAIPEYILNKPGRLTTAEFNKISEHPVVAAELLKNVEFPYPVVPVVLHHHEKWDGTGYPYGYKGEQIPVGARILAIADCYDALRSDRPYRQGFSKEKTLGIMAKESGSSFDPDLLQHFFAVVDQAEAKVGQLDAPHQGEAGRTGGADLVGRLARRRAQSVYQNIAAANQEVISLYEITQTLGSTLDLSELLSLITSELDKIIEFNACVIYLADGEEGTLKATHIIGADEGLLLDHVIRFGDGVSGWAAASREPLAGANPQGDFVALRHESLKKYTTSLVFPLLDDGEVLGVLSLYATAEISYAEDRVRVMDLVARHAATAVRNARRFEETQESALTDRLTGLPNSRYMYLFIEQELSKAAGHGYPVTLLMMDLDGFKRVNDQYGHHVGDELLRDLSKVLNGQVRRDDILVRYAGDEFVAVLIGTTPEQTREVIGRIQSSVDGYSMMVRGAKTVSVGISIGQAVFPDHGRTLEELMVIADANMYRNKDERRTSEAASISVMRVTN